MNFQQLEEKINAYINTNGERAITGANLNEILHDIVETVKSNIIPVQVTISGDVKSCTFLWPYEDTSLEDVKFYGYDGFPFDLASSLPFDGISILKNVTESVLYQSGVWAGAFSKLVKGQWYCLYVPSMSSGTNCTVYIGRKQSN